MVVFLDDLDTALMAGGAPRGGAAPRGAPLGGPRGGGPRALRARPGGRDIYI